jgi:ABC-2 type transport system ATP-binding protein
MEKCIEVRNLQQDFGTLRVLNNINLDIYKGEILGLLGPSGSGKTTLVKNIIGMNNPTRGSVTISGMNMPSLKAITDVGYMAQEDALYDDLNAIDNLLFFGALYGLKGSRARQSVAEVLETVQLTEHAKRLVRNYSGGMKRRLSLACALLHKPSILILDEPTVGIDPVLRIEFWKEFGRIRATGTSIVITTHAMDEAERCQRLAMIRGGDIIAIGSPEELKKNSSTSTVEGAFLYYSTTDLSGGAGL